MSGSAERVWALVRKESVQIVRDPSSVAIALLMPVLLLLLFGYGVSLDTDRVPVALVVEQAGPRALDVASAFRLSPYFSVADFRSLPEAEAALRHGEVDGIVHLDQAFDRRASAEGLPPSVQVIVNGTDANRARLILGYSQGALGLAGGRLGARPGGAAVGSVDLQPRVWFNPELRSRNFLIPGLVALVMTLIGALLTAMVMAREWERGTLEAMFVTPVRVGEILAGKLVPYFVLGMGGLAVSVAMALFVFHVPLRGSLVVLTGVSALFLLVALGMGLLISSATRNQFIAGQVALVATFLPAFLLSGMIFDVASTPAAVQVLTLAVPARYFVAIVQTLFLAGNVWSVILPNSLALAVMAVVLLTLTWRRTRKRLEQPDVLDSLLRIRALIVKELLAILKDPRSRFVLVGPPVIQLLVFGYAATFDLNRVPYAVWDQDRGSAARELLARIDGSGIFRRVENLTGPAEVERAIDARKVLLVVAIDQDFQRRLAAGQAAPLQVIVDGRNSNTASVALGYVQTIVGAFNARWSADHGGGPPAIEFTPRAWFNPNLESRWFIVPGLIGTLTLLVALLTTAMSVAREREQGTFDQLLVTPIRPIELIAGKAAPGFVVGFFEAALIYTVARLWFRIPFEGSLLTLALGVGTFLFSAIGVGLMISSLAVTMQQALLGTFLFMMPAVILSGFATPISGMPAFMQMLTLVNPLRYAVSIARRVFLEGAGLTLIAPDLWPMAVIGLVTMAAAGWLFRRRAT